MISGDQCLIVLGNLIWIALVIKYDELDRATKQSPISVDRIGPELVTLFHRQPIGLEVARKRQRGSDSNRFLADSSRSILCASTQPCTYQAYNANDKQKPSDLYGKLL